MKCGRCGAPLPDGAEFCPACGAKTGSAVRPAGGAGGGSAADRALDVIAHRRIIGVIAWLIEKAPLIGRIAGQLRFAEFTNMSRTLVLAVTSVAALLGLYPQPLGHIETTPFLTILMPIVSVVNPALGLASAIAFGICDFIEKMVTNNVYYEGTPGAGDYIGARIGFIISYSMVVAWGILPGILSHAFSRRALRWAERRVRARSLGAASTLTRNEKIVVAVAGGVGAALGGGIANLLNLGLMTPAFLFRPSPDFSCYNVAWGNLTKGIWTTAAAAGIGGPIAQNFVQGNLFTDTSVPEPEAPPPPSTSTAEDAYEAWKRKYESMGWRLTEKDGTATYEPVDGAVNEDGWVYDSDAGGFVQPRGEAPEPTPHRHGDVNAEGEVWSDRYGGWVGRNLFDEDERMASDIADIERRSDEKMRDYDETTRELGRKVMEAPREREKIARIFEERRRLEDAIDEIWRRDVEDGTLDENRNELLDRLRRKAEDLSLDKDRDRALEAFGGLGDVVTHQAREGFKPTYTYRDAVFDTAIQIGAAALDAVATGGYASTTVGSSLAMRDAAREGKSVTEILYEGVKSAVFDFGIGKASEWVGKAAGSVWRTVRGPAGEMVEQGLETAGRTRRAVTGGADDLMAGTRRNIDSLERNMTKDAAGTPRANLDDVLEMQRNPHQVRSLKETGSAELQDGFNNTLRNDVYKPHDDALVNRIKSSNPDLADRNVVVHEFRTPGKGGSGINTDRDFRVLYQNENGDWIEVPKKTWEADSNEIFSDLTGYDPSQAPANLSEAEKRAWWAEQHGHTPTDKSFREACPDYSDQVVNEMGERVTVDKPRIQELKEIADGKVELPADGPQVRLRDPEALGQQFDEKIHGNLRRNDPFEAVAQAQKGVETLQQVRTAYDVQGIDTGGLPDRFSKAMDLIRNSNLPATPDSADLNALQQGLGDLGFPSLDDFGKALSSQFESLKLAR